MVVRVPSFRAITSGIHTWEEIFSDGDYMFQLWKYYRFFKTIIFDCLDFTLVKSDDTGELICAIKDDIESKDISRNN